MQLKHLRRTRQSEKRRRCKRSKSNDITRCDSKPINEASHTGWTTYGHTGEDVDIYAQGPGSEKFRGNIDNTDNAKTSLISLAMMSLQIKINKNKLNLAY